MANNQPNGPASSNRKCQICYTWYIKNTAVPIPPDYIEKIQTSCSKYLFAELIDVSKCTWNELPFCTDCCQYLKRISNFHEQFVLIQNQISDLVDVFTLKVLKCRKNGMNRSDPNINLEIINEIQAETEVPLRSSVMTANVVVPTQSPVITTDVEVQTGDEQDGEAVQVMFCHNLLSKPNIQARIADSINEQRSNAQNPANEEVVAKVCLKAESEIDIFLTDLLRDSGSQDDVDSSSVTGGESACITGGESAEKYGKDYVDVEQNFISMFNDAQSIIESSQGPTKVNQLHSAQKQSIDLVEMLSTPKKLETSTNPFNPTFQRPCAETFSLCERYKSDAGQNYSIVKNHCGQSVSEWGKLGRRSIAPKLQGSTNKRKAKGATPIKLTPIKAVTSSARLPCPSDVSPKTDTITHQSLSNHSLSVIRNPETEKGQIEVVEVQRPTAQPPVPPTFRMIPSAVPATNSINFPKVPSGVPELNNIHSASTQANLLPSIIFTGSLVRPTFQPAITSSPLKMVRPSTTISVTQPRPSQVPLSLGGVGQLSLPQLPINIVVQPTNSSPSVPQQIEPNSKPNINLYSPITPETAEINAELGVLSHCKGTPQNPYTELKSVSSQRISALQSSCSRMSPLLRKLVTSAQKVSAKTSVIAEAPRPNKKSYSTPRKKNHVRNLQFKTPPSLGKISDSNQSEISKSLKRKGDETTLPRIKSKKRLEWSDTKNDKAPVVPQPCPILMLADTPVVHTSTSNSGDNSKIQKSAPPTDKCDRTEIISDNSKPIESSFSGQNIISVKLNEFPWQKPIPINYVIPKSLAGLTPHQMEKVSPIISTDHSSIRKYKKRKKKSEKSSSSVTTKRKKKEIDQVEMLSCIQKMAKKVLEQRNETAVKDASIDAPLPDAQNVMKTPKIIIRNKNEVITPSASTLQVMQDLQLSFSSVSTNSSPEIEAKRKQSFTPPTETNIKLRQIKSRKSPEDKAAQADAFKAVLVSKHRGRGRTPRKKPQKTNSPLRLILPKPLVVVESDSLILADGPQQEKCSNATVVRILPPTNAVQPVLKEQTPPETKAQSSSSTCSTIDKVNIFASSYLTTPLKNDGIDISPPLPPTPRVCVIMSAENARASPSNQLKLTYETSFGDIGQYFATPLKSGKPITPGKPTPVVQLDKTDNYGIGSTGSIFDTPDKGPSLPIKKSPFPLLKAAINNSVPKEVIKKPEELSKIPKASVKTDLKDVHAYAFNFKVSGRAKQLTMSEHDTVIGLLHMREGIGSPQTKLPNNLNPNEPLTPNKELCQLLQSANLDTFLQNFVHNK